MSPAEVRRGPFDRLAVFLIRPSKYDDDGYLLRHWRGVLPSNTLACLNALTLDVARHGALADIRISVDLCDESVQAIPARRIERLARRPRTRVLLCLVGVQTSQMPRAVDIALRFRRRGVAVLIGGFHVSGSIAMKVPAPELDALRNAGVTLVAGEVEDAWEGILRDAALDRLAPLYDLLAAKPSLERSPAPHLDRRLMRRFVYRQFATVDGGRGCPFECSFCTIINVQGRTMRNRRPESVVQAIDAAERDQGVDRWFFTDDNFARNPRWRELFEGLARRRDEGGASVGFLMQVDLLAHRIPGFVQLARAAGCFQVFLGLESLDPENLGAAKKRQNRTHEFSAALAAWREAGILTHVGYIIGFPHDTEASVRSAIRALQDDLEVDIASFFMLCPLPGSADHRALIDSGASLDADLSRYDTFHAIVDHPRMSRASWFALYREAWWGFYSDEHMERRLAAAPPALRSTLLQMYLWYGAAIEVERFHPMMTGFVRRKPRCERASGRSIEGRVQHLRRRARETRSELQRYVRLARRLKAVWEAVHPEEPRGWGAFLGALRAPATAAPPPSRAPCEPSWRRAPAA